MGSHLSDVWFRTTDLEIVSGSGCVVRTAGGVEYLDFTAGIAVASTGHCHPRVVEAIQQQAAQIIHAQANCYRSPLPEQLATRLAQITPSSIDTFFFTNSGAEATEAAVKLARHATGRPNVIVVQGGFHGRTYLTMAMTTSKVGVRAGYQPLPAGIFATAFPRPFAWKVDETAAVERALAELRLLLLTQTAPSETAAFVMEPVLGEGGYLPAPVGFVRGAAEICAEHGILFVADEVQTGFARTGRMFAVEHAGIEPDIIVMAKGIASGFPIAAIGARSELMARWNRGAHGGIFGLRSGIIDRLFEGCNVFCCAQLLDCSSSFRCFCYRMSNIDFINFELAIFIERRSIIPSGSVSAAVVGKAAICILADIC